MALRFLRTTDYDSIREVLGVEKTDVYDSLIETLPFGPQAERLLIEQVSDLVALYDVYSLVFDGEPTGGSVGLTFDGQTATVPWNSSAAALQTLLEGLSSIGAGNVTVTGGPLPAAVSIVFGGTLLDTDDPITLTNALTGGTAPTPVVTHRSTQMTKLALIYATAALLAEQYGQGGLIGHGRGANSDKRDPSEQVDTLWGWYYRYANLLAEGEAEPEVAGLDLLRGEDDIESIRQYLGVDETTLPNKMVGYLPFGPQAERLVKRAVPDWQTRLTAYEAALADVPQTDDDAAAIAAFEPLRMAAMYATGALVAESFAARGNEKTIPSKDWSDLSETLWGWYFKLVAEAMDDGGVSEEPVIVGLIVTGPTRANGYWRTSPIRGVGWVTPAYWPWW